MPDIAKILDQFVRKRILIVGEISAANCNNHTSTLKEIPPASAALISLYASSLGATVSLVGTIGPDTVGNSIVNTLRNKNVNMSGITINPAKPTPCWKKIHEGTTQTSLNIITEKQMTEAALQQALNARAILYVCQNQANYSPKVFKELKKVSTGLKIPLAIFANPAFAESNRIRNDLFLMYNPKQGKLGKELCKKLSAEECLILKKSNGFSQINKNSVKHCPSKLNAKQYQYEAAIAALAVLLLACHQYPNYLPQLAKNMRLNNSHMAISQESEVRSPK